MSTPPVGGDKQTIEMRAVQLEIEKLVYGGWGLARTEDGVVFVPRTAPGDIVEAVVTQKKRDYSVAQMVRLLEPSGWRRQPSCPNYETAGCCHWQHIRYERQLEIKEGIVRETLQRLIHMPWIKPIAVISGPDQHYRMRAVFHVTPRGELGFVREKSHIVVPIRECSALAPELNAFLQQSHGRFSTREVAAVSTSSVEVLGIRYRVAPDTFFQANRFLLGPFAEEVVSQTEPSGCQILELYCGSGFFSLQLARQAARVTGVEAEARAVRQAIDNACQNEIGRVEFLQSRTDAFLDTTQVRPDVIVLNPPRAGAGTRNAERMARLGARRIVYVSCNPATFAREAAILWRSGYELERLTMVDQFPNTYHIEIIGTFDFR
jgi:23S rRNA (uracil1939-C5)-methyltransferase